VEGYAGKILEVDLTRRRSRVRPLDEAMARAYLGGRGLAVRLLWDALPAAHTDPLSPDNVLIFATGPLTGFPVPGASRTSIATKSPATSPRGGAPGASALALGQMPGHFAVELKFAGYDALVVRGKATEPVALVIRDEEVEFRPAFHLWGKEIPEAEKTLREELPKEPFQTVVIGPAGERLVPLATALHNFPCSSHAGRGGIGAVMGSKNLKAVAVRGTLHPFDLANPKAFEELTQKAVQALQAWPQYEAWRRWGTAALVEAGSDSGILAVRNFREGTFPEVARIGAVRAEAAYWMRSEACYYCPLHCRKVALLQLPGSRGAAVPGPELETSAMLGANCGVDDLQGILAVKSRCDALGLDPSSTGNLLGFLMEAADKRLVTPSDLGGVSLGWGNGKAMAALADLVGRPEGKAAWLARGVRAAAQTLGRESGDWAMEVKGLEMDAYNVPALPAMVVVYGTSPAGAAHELGHSPEVQDQRAVSDSLGLCRFHLYPNPLEAQAAVLAAVTGIQRSARELLTAGERIWSLERAFLVREGFGPADDRLPPRSKKEAFTLGPRKGAILSPAAEDKILSDYYAARGWNPGTASPLAATFRRLGMDDVAEAVKAS
jgi:aldehyde:ferredoxin oxidoreductase